MARISRKPVFRSARGAEKNAMRQRRRLLNSLQRKSGGVSRESRRIALTGGFFVFFLATLVWKIHGGFFGDAEGGISNDRYGRGVMPGGFFELLLVVGAFVFFLAFIRAVREWQAMRLSKAALELEGETE